MRRRFTFFPWGPVWRVTRMLPRSSLAYFLTSSGEWASLTPPASPRPPAWIWAFTTHHRCADTLRCSHRILHGECGISFGHMNAIFLHNGLALILMYIHKHPPFGNERTASAVPGKARKTVFLSFSMIQLHFLSYHLMCQQKR